MRSPRPPARTAGQRLDALRRANETRASRAALKADLRNGRVRIEDVLSDPPEYVRTARVAALLTAIPRVGQVKAARILNQCRIGQSKTVAGLTDRQRASLADLLQR